MIYAMADNLPFLWVYKQIVVIEMSIGTRKDELSFNQTYKERESK